MKFKRKLNSSGTTLIEYALIAALICTVMLVGLKKVGEGYKDIYNRIGNSIEVGEPDNTKPVT